MADWTWPTDAPADPNRDLPVFTVSPNWKNGILETLQWLTDVMSSEIAMEQRRAARRYPRRTFEMGFMRRNEFRARIDNFLSGVGYSKFLLPLWHEQLRLGVATVDNAVVFPAGTLETREYHPGDLVLVLQNPNVYSILTVITRNETTDTITLAGTSTTGTWPAGSKIVPLRVARIAEAGQMVNHTDQVATSQIKFQLSDIDTTVDPSWGYCSPLWQFKPDRATTLDVTFDRSAFMLDMGAGVIEVADPGNRAQISMSLAVTLFGRAAVTKFRRFLYMARGRARRFYIPTYSNDITPTEDMFGETFDGVVNGFSDYQAVPQEARRIIGVVFHDGRPTVYRNIIGVTPVLSGTAPFRQIAERFLLDQDMPPILAREVKRIQFMMPVRFDQDTFEIQHVTDQLKAVKSALAVKSSVVEGMPPIECWVTSRPYPLNLNENLGLSAALTDGNLNIGPTPVESMGLVDTLTDGDLNTVLLGAWAPVESISLTGMLTDGELDTVLLGAWAPVESMGLVDTLTNGTLANNLITYVANPTENMAISATLTNGTLT